MEQTYNPFSLIGKTVLVTGASSGIGRATAIECSKMGATVIITGRNIQRLEETFRQLTPGNLHQMFTVELTNRAELEVLVKQLPVLNGIVHCAGKADHVPFTFLKEEYLREMFDVNFFPGVLLSTGILKAKKIVKGASIVFITSISGILSCYLAGTAYAATKGALNGVIKGMAVDLASKKIRVNSVMPAMVDTTIMQKGDIDQEQLMKDAQRYPLKRYGRPEEVAYAVIYLLSDASQWTTGSNLLLDGGITTCY